MTSDQEAGRLACEHDIDPLSFYCCRCGKPAQEIVDGRLPCVGGNVSSIMPEIVRRRLMGVIAPILARLGLPEDAG